MGEPASFSIPLGLMQAVPLNATRFMEGAITDLAGVRKACGGRRSTGDFVRAAI